MSGEKTEQPTGKRLADARKRGDVPRSRDLVAFAVLAAAYAAAVLAGPAMLARLRASIARGLAAAAAPETAVPGRVLYDALLELALVSVPVLAAMMLVGASVAFLDAGPVLALGRVLPRSDRLDPFRGAGQLIARDRFVDLLKSAAALVALAAVAAVTLADAAPSLARLAAASPAPGLGVLAALLGQLVSRSLGVLAGLAALDVVLSRQRHAKSLGMTKDEVRREYRESEGDPRQKGERARMHREILEHSVLESVRRADVLVVNPTHLAVALRFDVAGDQDAPEVVAKGEDALATRMIAAAREAGVPVMRDVPLARTLYDLDLGDEVPPLLYEAVAAVLQAAWAERRANDPDGDEPA